MSTLHVSQLPLQKGGSNGKGVKVCWRADQRSDSNLATFQLYDVGKSLLFGPVF